MTQSVSRQREWQRRMRDEGRCMICGNPAAPSKRTKSGIGIYCVAHRTWHREYLRRWKAKQ